MDLELTMGADSLTQIRTWVDASYAVHPDMRSHTGGVISFGTGGIICKSSKQKLNTKSSTEAELIGASDYIPHTIWLKYFLEAQGYKVEKNFFEQDNESAIRLEKNGKASAGQKSRHINIRYFFIKDRVKSENIDIRHCPTLQMLADFFTKPLQGNLFKKFRDVILGYKHVNTLVQSTPSPVEERVEDRAESSAVCPSSANEITTTNQVETTNAVNHRKNEKGTEMSNPWITVTGKKKVSFRDMRGNNQEIVTTH